MPESKDEFIERAVKELQEFKQYLDDYMQDKAKDLDKLGGKPDEHFIMTAHNDFTFMSLQFTELMDKLTEEAHSIGIERGDRMTEPIGNMFISIQQIFHHPNEYFSKIRKGFKIRKKEPITNLAPVPGLEEAMNAVLTKDEIEKQIFELNDKKQKTQSIREKDTIQKEIDRLVRLYQQSNYYNGPLSKRAIKKGKK